PHDTARVHHLSALSPTMAGGAVLQVDQTTPAHQAVLRHVGERGEDASLDRRQHVRACRYRPKASGLTVVAAFDAANSQRHTIREAAFASTACRFADRSKSDQRS